MNWKTTGIHAVFIIGLIAIAFAIIGHYGTHGFKPIQFLLFELPLYVFYGWGLWMAFKIYRNSIERKDQNKKEKH